MYYGFSGIKKAGGYASFCCIKKTCFQHCFFTLSIFSLYPNFLPLCFYSIIWKYLSASIIASLFLAVTCGTFALPSALVISNSDISNLTLISASGAFQDNKTHVSICIETLSRINIRGRVGAKYIIFPLERLQEHFYPVKV